MTISLPAKIIQDEAVYFCERHGQQIQLILWHGTGGTNSYSTLKYGDGRGVSVHYLVNQDASAYRFLPDNLGANHAGYGTWRNPITGVLYSRTSKYSVNTISLGIEIESQQTGNRAIDYTEDQLIVAGDLTNQWLAKFPGCFVRRHVDVDPTRRKDPIGLSIADIDFYCAKASQIRAAGAISTLPPASSKEITYWQVKPGITASIREENSRKGKIALQGAATIKYPTVMQVYEIVKDKNGENLQWLHFAPSERSLGFADRSAFVQVNGQ